MAKRPKSHNLRQKKRNVPNPQQMKWTIEKSFDSFEDAANLRRELKKGNPKVKIHLQGNPKRFCVKTGTPIKKKGD
jgi:hypothetical protein